MNASTSIAPRWDWLQSDLLNVGIDSEISKRNGKNGSSFIELRLPDGDWFSIQDQFARGYWAGWTVNRIDADGFSTSLISCTKDQSEIVAAAKIALGLLKEVTA